MNKVLFSKKSDHWRTPSDIYSYLINDNNFVDPCPFMCNYNGLEVDYYSSKLFINPPYSDLSSWVDYSLKQVLNGNIIVLLIPARTDTKYFHKLLNCSYISIDILFVKGRLKFNDFGSAPFPSLFIKISLGRGIKVVNCLDDLL